MFYRTLPGGTSVSALALGVMMFGTTVPEETGFAILDRFVEAGGTFIDTSDNYAYWVPGATGSESETVLGRWLAARGNRDDLVISTKVGARPLRPGGSLADAEGLSAAAIRAAIAGSLQRLGTDHVDVYFAHIEDRSVELAETVGAFADLVAEGKVGVPGASNHAVWRLERARNIAAAAGLPGFGCVQQRYSYVHPRPDRSLENDGHVHASADLLDYLATEQLPMMAYSALLSGAYTRSDRTLVEAYNHPGTTARLAALREVADEMGVTPNQAVLAWLTGAAAPIVPLVGVSSVEQLDEILAGIDLKLDGAHRARLDATG